MFGQQTVGGCFASSQFVLGGVELALEQLDGSGVDEMLLFSLGDFLLVLLGHLSQFKKFVVRRVQLLLNSLPLLLQRGLCSFGLFQLPGQSRVRLLAVFSCTL